MDPITIAMGLAQFAPTVIKWITGNDKAADAAEKVVSIAQEVTGKETGAGALAQLRLDPAAAMAFRQKVMDNETELDRMYLADVQNARSRSIELAKLLGAKNWRPDVMFVLAILVITGLVWMIWKSTDLSEYVKGIFTLVLGRFLGYLDNIYNFEFGSTRSNKTKDATIENLTKRE